MSEVVHARVDIELLSKVDAMVERGLFPNRSGLIREATRELVSRVFSQATNERMEAVARASGAVIAGLEGLGVARVELYGSVARKEADENSDVDLLVLVDEGHDVDEATTAIVEAIGPISTATETTVTPLVMKKGEFEKALADGFSFAKSVSEDGVVLYVEAPEEGKRRAQNTSPRQRGS